MIWRFDYTLPTLIFLFFFLVFYFIRPVILTRSNKYYLSLIFFEIIGFAVTTLSCFFDMRSENCSRTFLTFMNTFYFNIFNARYFIISLYFASFLNINPKKDIPTCIMALSLISLIIFLVLNPLHEKVYFLDDMGKWNRGSLFFLVYLVNYLSLILDLYYIITRKRKFNKKEMVIAIFTVLTLLACSIIDFLCQDYLITDIFFIFVILLLYLGFENPDNLLDKKTGLLNGQAFVTILQEYLFTEKEFSVVSFIIQNYTEKKQIYGTKLMDKALAEMAQYFPMLFETKKIFYLSNGNFVVIVNKKKDVEDLEEKVKERYTLPWIVNNCELHLNVLVIDKEDDVKFSSFEEIMSGYTIAFHDAVKDGNDHITITKESFDAIKRKTQVTKALNKAILENSLLVYLQPIIESKTRKIIGAEALVRIDDEELGIIPPIEFITMAEKNGSIEQLGEQVLNKVCEFLNNSDIYEEGINWINVNLSPVQCQNKNLPIKIDNIVAKNTIDHQYIHLEITEDSMIETTKLKKQMNILITDGYKFSLDDFGSGFSNVVKVKTYPFSNIKLDLTLVWDHFENPDSMLPSMVSNFKERGLTITAEGVETKEMADGLEKMGVDFLQGYYFSKPLPMDEFVELVKKQNKDKK